VTRIRLPVGRILFFLAAFLFALAATLPLRVAAEWLGLPRHGFAAREATGTVWIGALQSAQYGRVPIGDVGTQLRTLPLLLGRARVSLHGPQGLSGAATVRPGGFSLDDLAGRVPVGAVFAPLPLAALDLQSVTARFADGRCAEASGLVRAQISGELGGVVLPGGLSGTARCDEAALLLPLASQSGMEQVGLRIHADGSYRADLAVRPPDDGVRSQLLAAGFAPAGDALVLTTEGRF
jgi:general secretion pathway protein N